MKQQSRSSSLNIQYKENLVTELVLQIDDTVEKSSGD